MTVTVAAFRDGVDALRAHPRLLVGGLLVGVARHPRFVGRVIDAPGPSAGVGLACLLALPFVAGGFVGLARAALAGDEASAGAFLASARTHYLRLGAGICLFVVLVVGVAIGLGLVSLAVGAGGLLLARGSEAASVATSVGAVLVWAAALFGVVLSVQFFTAAVVIEGRGVVASFRRSVSLVRSHPASVLGFSILWSGASHLVVVPGYAVGTPATDGAGAGAVTLPLVDLAVPSAVAVPVAIGVSTVASAYLYTVYVAYYVRLSGDESASAPDADSDSGSGFDADADSGSGAGSGSGSEPGSGSTPGSDAIPDSGPGPGSGPATAAGRVAATATVAGD
jgi:hypothetical protein